MIRYISAKQIDRTKYDLCIDKSRECRIYAFSWYLDCTCDRWDLLVMGDYEIVMPLPIRVKFGIPYIYVPSWIQQLGLFSEHKIDENHVKDFMAAIPNRIRWIDYHFNSLNKLPGDIVILRKNYLLPLVKNIEEIKSDFNSNRKRIAKKSFKEYVIDKNGDTKVFISNYKKMEKTYQVSDQSIGYLENLCETRNGSVHIWNVFKQGVFVAGLIWLQDKNRITYLVPVADHQAKKMHIPTYIINELINEFQLQNFMLDFEGSMVKGVENFYQSFGAKPEFYSYYKKRIF